MTHDDIKQITRQSIQDRVREGIKAVLVAMEHRQKLLEEEMDVQLQARHESVPRPGGASATATTAGAWSQNPA